MSEPLSGRTTSEPSGFDAPPSDPLALAQRWLAEAREAEVAEPLSMTLATASGDGVVSARTVDVKRIDDRGLVFGTSDDSDKGRQLAENPHAALQVYWRETMQQLRFEGRIERLSDAESDALFADRSPASRAATAVARQSQPFDDRPLDDLLRAADDLLETEGDAVPRPPAWRALRLVPDRVEFWQGSRDRMHRRLGYDAGGDAWRWRPLQP